MLKRVDIVTTARTYLKTPFHHQGRVKGVGVDCIGLLVCVARELNLFHHDIEGYSRYPDGVTIMRELPKCLDETNSPLNGDVLVFWFDKPSMPSHAAIKTDLGMIHTYSLSGAVVEHTINKVWQRRICGAFSFRGVE